MTQKLDSIFISYTQTDFEQRKLNLLSKPSSKGRFSFYDSDESKSVVDILREVAQKGDDALEDYTAKFDGVSLNKQFRVPLEELENAHKQAEPKLLNSIRQAINNVRQYQSEIFIGNKNTHSGIKYTPIKRVGICVPGAAAPLFSTVIMTVVPAQVAGVKEVAVVSPPRYEGSIHPGILAVCYELGLSEVYRIGGAQAVAALAFGTQTVQKVDKIVGPGNKWVQNAKKNVSGDYVAIDSIAGPSEVLIVANSQAKAAWIAADMLSQAEHAHDSKAVVVTDSKQIGEEILRELKTQLKQLSRTDDALKSLIEFGAIVVVKDMGEVISFANNFAAEHLQIQCGSESRKIAEKIENAGAIFIGDYTPVAVGDYWAGPSHTLPTGRTAKFSSALTSNDFIKSISIIEYSKEQLAQSAEDIIDLAQAEGLDAHAKSVQIRQQK